MMSASAISRCASPVVVVVVVVVVVGGWLEPLGGCPLKLLDADPAQPAEAASIEANRSALHRMPRANCSDRASAKTARQARRPRAARRNHDPAVAIRAAGGYRQVAATVSSPPL
jgi:hypothetical protein